MAEMLRREHLGIQQVQVPESSGMPDWMDAARVVLV